ncbi:MAG: cytochrome c [Gammaproteobacteria bacterium]|nr:cytochrome c [Gammaproteobacteria bacterium]
MPEREERLERLHLPSEPVAADPGRGAEFFRMHCAVCHGPAARGTEQGPPLVHDLYRPGRHADLAFHRAVSTGTKQHHWKFGDMPAMPQIEPAAVEHIIAFIRREQRRAGVIE